MAGRMVTVCHVWPGITPWNIWDLRVEDWLRFAKAADDWEARRRGDG